MVLHFTTVGAVLTHQEKRILTWRGISLNCWIRQELLCDGSCAVVLTSDFFNLAFFTRWTQRILHCGKENEQHLLEKVLYPALLEKTHVTDTSLQPTVLSFKMGAQIHMAHFWSQLDFHRINSSRKMSYF